MALKTLLVTYLPHADQSHTHVLVDAFCRAAGDSGVKRLDLLEDVPDYFDVIRVTAYGERNYMGKALSPEQRKAMAKMDRMTAQFKAADIVVTAFPMFNFSMPGLVKAYFDSILLKGETWDAGPHGYTGLMKDRKALVLTTTGGVYEGPSAARDHLHPLAVQLFRFMGFSEIEVISAQGMNARADQADELLADACAKIEALVKRWYR